MAAANALMTMKEALTGFSMSNSRHNENEPEAKRWRRVGIIESSHMALARKYNQDMIMICCNMDSTTSATLPTFHSIPIRLTRENYHYWRIQILSMVKAHGFEEFLFGTVKVPPKVVEGKVNPEYTLWLRRDQLLFSWIIASISESMMGHITRCNTFSNLWSVLETVFRSQSRARVQHLKAQLHSSKKGDLSISDYILHMQGIVDNIHVAGVVLPDDDLILHILNGLGVEYESIVVNLTARTEDLTLQDVQYALQTHEMRLQQISQQNPSDSVHVTHIHVAHLANTRAFSSDTFNNRGGFHGGNRGGQFFRGRGRGRFSRNRPSCQICGKNNHIASKCFKRFDVNFTGVDLSSAQAHFLTTQSEISNTPSSGSCMPLVNHAQYPSMSPHGSSPSMDPNTRLAVNPTIDPHNY
ncbi:hypothetical protein DH2020_014488 [Rehmannia glutinosa]|uniref:Retrotransposon Copia-like N-terminal domain-containing protein n=1 Tax=Rehmannia glutinosa TaxID=99300 RepID=A0ABR0WWI5_REHGL